MSYCDKKESLNTAVDSTPCSFLSEMTIVHLAYKAL